MKEIYIYGVGAGYKIVKTCLLQENILVLAYIDENASKFPNGIDGIPVITVDQIDATKSFDFVVITIMQYESIIENLIRIGVSKEKVISFFSLQDSCKELFWCVLERSMWKMEVLSHLYTNEVKPFINNVKYELLDEINRNTIHIPQVMSIEETVQEIYEKKKSVCRFGDGEFELIYLHKRAKFQEVNEELANRLKEVLHSNNEDIAIAIADNYGSLNQYTEKGKKDIRNYLTKEIRNKHYALLDMNRKYYNAYFTRPYIIYHDKENADKRFQDLKQIWKGKNTLIVEGDKTRFGVGNDLLIDAARVQRVIAPSENAFSVYDNILSAVKEHGKNKLILVALGPTATVLAYDLAREGYWAIDIGHVDIEYEWYKRQVDDKCIIPYKYVNEVAHGECVIDNKEFFSYQEKYEREIIEKIYL